MTMYLVSWGDWKELQATPMVSERGNRGRTLVLKVVDLPYLHVFDITACVLLCMIALLAWLCVTICMIEALFLIILWPWVRCIKHWACRNAIMLTWAYVRQAFPTLAFILHALFGIICYWDSPESHPPLPTNR